MNGQSKILVLGAVLALVLIFSGMALGGNKVGFSFTRGGNHPVEGQSQELWQKMHQACLAGDWEAMMEAMPAMHAACFAQMGMAAQGMMGGMMGGMMSQFKGRR